MLENFFHQGSLFCSQEEHKVMPELMKEKPTILTEINAVMKALIADFGTFDEVLAEILFGKKSKCKITI